MLIFYLAYISTLKMEVTCSSEMSVDFQWTTYHIPEDRSPQFRYVLNIVASIACSQGLVDCINSRPSL
jgi:hypothetical protein